MKSIPGWGQKHVQQGLGISRQEASQHGQGGGDEGEDEIGWGCCIGQCFTHYHDDVDFKRITLATTWKMVQFSSVQLLSRAQLCNPMDCSTPGFPVLHHLLENVQTHIYWVSGAIQPSHPLSSPSPLSSILPSIKPFPLSWLSESGGQSIGASTSVSVLPMNIQGWFPLGLTGLISLLSKGLSRVVSSTTIWKRQFFRAQLSLCMFVCKYEYIRTQRE